MIPVTLSCLSVCPEGAEVNLLDYKSTKILIGGLDLKQKTVSSLMKLTKIKKAPAYGTLVGWHFFEQSKISNLPLMFQLACCMNALASLLLINPKSFPGPANRIAARYKLTAIIQITGYIQVIGKCLQRDCSITQIHTIELLPLLNGCRFCDQGTTHINICCDIFIIDFGLEGHRSIGVRNPFKKLPVSCGRPIGDKLVIALIFGRDDLLIGLSNQIVVPAWIWRLHRPTTRNL